MSVHHRHPDAPEHIPDFTPIALHKPYWRRAHRDWKFWVAVVAIFAALAIYVVTVDLSI